MACYDTYAAACGRSAASFSFVLLTFTMAFGRSAYFSSHIVLFMECVLLVAVLFRVVLDWLLPASCYLVDYCCTEQEDNAAVTEKVYTEFMSRWKTVDENNIAFQTKILLRSGLGDETYAPPRLMRKVEDASMEDARAETENLIAVAAKRLLRETGVEGREIDIVIINSSLFNPSPSLSAFAVRTLKLRSNVKTFNLAGMGCSAGLLSIDLAKHLLRVHKNSYALVLSTENITNNFYFGNKERSMMLANALFRCGCAAILLSNKHTEGRRAKLELLRCVRTHLGADQKAFESVQHRQDDDGFAGVSLQTNLVEVAGTALRANITKLAPSILPLMELLKVSMSMVRVKLSKSKDAKLYVPNFKKAIDHFCIHPGGRAVIDAIGKGLKLSEYDIDPGRMALKRFGNTSGSGVWYALAYCEAQGRLKKGDKVWQIALGSGFKCNSGVWRVLRNIDPSDCVGCNPWMKTIDKYPGHDIPVAHGVQVFSNDKCTMLLRRA
ncbi:hypothetical protein KP509_38G004900 [Ceratopteris richardii]|uniref:3-ketoacyl-CoA synthase n=1 Tax=Ceratopteris richardii TaxID=49495 RepID=A0A8T2Q1J8_CERRI|nr:hypothetical protein KP509_38G004900 [Ceratopteris richardii]